MKRYALLVAVASLAAPLTSCGKKSNGVWDDNKTTSQMKNGSRSLWGNDDGFSGPGDDEFIALRDEDLKAQFADRAIPQSKFSPGEPGSHLPGVDGFRNPAGDMASVFRTIHFNTDDATVRGDEYLSTINRAAAYLKAHPNTYIFVSGHCDERGAEAYNLALGTRRANTIRTMLVDRGVNLNQIFTISYGKDHPVIDGHTPQVWAKNRRAEFKIFQR